MKNLFGDIIKAAVKENEKDTAATTVSGEETAKNAAGETAPNAANKPLRTELVFILDRSGSMHGLESDTVGGFNSMLEKQKQQEGECRITTVLFDDKCELLHDRLDIRGVREISEREYYVRGCTALLDAVGMTITKLVNVQRSCSPEMRADKVIFVIITDGMENASREYNYSRVKQMVELEKEKYGWEFMFLGANIDAAAAAENIGIGRDRAVRYHADRAGTQLNYEVVAEAVKCARYSGAVPKEWKARIENDYHSRECER